MAMEPPRFTPSSDDLSSTAETLSTFSSSSTQWGPGALTGKALKALGETTLDLLCRVLIRRRLAVIRQTLEKSPGVFTNPSSAKEWRQRDAIYINLDELCRGDYPIALRKAAAHLLRDIVSLISRFLPEAPSDSEYKPLVLGQLTSLFSAPMHTQWASLLSRLQRHTPYLLSGHGPSISVSKWTSGPHTQEPAEGISDENAKPETYLVTVSGEPSSIDQQPKVLVLGVGGVGKSTLIKQQARVFSEAPGLYTHQVAAEVIVNNTMASLKSLLLSIPPSELWYYSLQTILAIQEFPLISTFSPMGYEDIRCMIHSLWQDPGVRKAAQTRRALLSDDLFVASDSLEYFVESADRIFGPNYNPTLHDFLRSRVRTTGAYEMVLASNTYSMRFIDTGGELSERKKWIHLVKDVTAVLYVVALSDYNRSFCYTGSSNMNRMDDSLETFDIIVNSPYVASSLITLIFNKEDIFAQQLEISPLEQWMPDYTGKTYNDACKYIESRFTSLIKNKSRPFRIHYTTAIDEEMMEKSINIRDEIVRHHQQQRETHGSHLSSSADTHIPTIVISSPGPK